MLTKTLGNPVRKAVIVLAAIALITGNFYWRPAANAAGLPNSCGSRYGGPSYDGAPKLELAASLAAAGGGSAHFSAARALTSMVGASLTNAEVARLSHQYGMQRVQTWLKVFDFVVRDATRIATSAGIRFPPAKLRHKALASALVNNGVVNHTFSIEYLLDTTVSHRIHEKVMDDIDVRFGPKANADYHKISNQAFYDLARALGANIKLSSFH